jgi:hypothetical protein
VSAATVDSLRDTVEEFSRAADLEYYEHFSGRKDKLEMARIVERFGAAFTSDALRAVLDAAGSAGDDAERRRHLALAQAVASVCMERELAVLGDELATAEAQATVDVDGETIGYYSAAVAVQNEPGRERRRRIDAARMEVLHSFDPLRQRIFTRHHELIGELGFPGYIDFYSTLKQIDLHQLGAVMRSFLERTDDLYRAVMAPWFEEVIGVPFSEAERHDAGLLMRMSDRDSWFTTDAMLPALRQTLLELGVALDDQPNVHLDTEDRPGKNPRAFCAPVRAPEEVYLVIRPTGGYQDYRALFHEAGHTEHFAHVEATRPFEERLLGDNSVTEAFAFTMEHLLLDDAFVGDLAKPGADELAGFMHRAHAYYLYMLRRYAAKITYELELHSAGPAGLDRMPQRYAEWFSQHLGFRYRSEPYLDDVDAGFYCAQYLRAWMLEAQLRERWRGQHGDRWWRAGGAGDELRWLWSLGQALPADLLTVELGMGALGIDALERRLRAGLRTG